MWEAYQQSSQNLFLILFVFGLLNTAVSLAFYLKIPFALFFRKTAEETPVVTLSWGVTVLSLVLTLPIILLFLKTDWLINWISGL
ncbi:hypothetical protein BWI96_08745 [Siphonobacter sp. SORGH_AS_0500]|uniref:hypothetical protein n=1 Tax=Siphonobacter sp. SORGH_AS_0500 TaxID=1864824 RepID=UPI000CBABFE7|nr:hypothetical protein [Siphonobacter sp. SORGH_AS_0500]PKK36961.1 hypothetical protein BWI96_08745 [Siphonobacter sp. SORGH_AS_0500]